MILLNQTRQFAMGLTIRSLSIRQCSPLFSVITVGLVPAVGLVGSGLGQMREQRRHGRAMLRDNFKRRRAAGRATVHSSGPPPDSAIAGRG